MIANNLSTVEKKLEEIITLAQYAPSVHNSQPWIITVHKNTVVVGIDEENKLEQGDPTGRETFISLGIFCEAIAIAAGSFGFSLKSEILKDKEVSLEFANKGKVESDSKELIRLLRQRSTDRSIYKPTTVNKEALTRLTNSYKKRGVTIHVVTERENIDEIADLTARGIGVALSSPDFREELSHLLVLPWSRSKRGISVFSLRIPSVIALMEPLLIRVGFGLKHEVSLEKKRWQSASAVILITTKGDMQADWFVAGKAYLRSALTAEALGLSQATSAATVEASSFHEDVESILSTQERLQSVTRLGAGSSRKTRSPRIPARELIATSS